MKDIERDTLRIIDGSELPADYGDIGFFDIDRIVFAEQYAALSETELGSSNLSQEWYLRNPEIYTVLLAGSKVVGYCNTMPLKEEAFFALVQGRISDGDIKPEMIERFDKPGSYRMFCCGIAILEEHRHGGLALRKILGALIEKFTKLAERGCRISDIAAVAWTPDGHALCGGLGLRQISTPQGYGDIYCADINEVLGSKQRALLRRFALKYQARRAAL